VPIMGLPLKGRLNIETCMVLSLILYIYTSIPWVPLILTGSSACQSRGRGTSLKCTTPTCFWNDPTCTKCGFFSRSSEIWNRKYIQQHLKHLCASEIGHISPIPSFSQILAGC